MLRKGNDFLTAFLVLIIILTFTLSLSAAEDYPKLEAYGFHYSDYGKFSGSLKAGKMCCLRFPELDLIFPF